MKNLFASFILIFGLCFSGNAQEKTSFQITADSIRFFGDSDSKVISNNKLMEHVEIFKKVNGILSSFNKSKSFASQLSSIDSAQIMCNKKANTCEYRHLKAGHPRWTWYVFGRRKDKHIGTAAMMAIDSETGEVLFKKIE
jgi:hypothetical protein